MAVTAVNGADFTVSVASTDYSDQVTTGSISTSATVTETETLGGVAVTQGASKGTANLSFLYDDNAGLYDALMTAQAAGDSVAVSVTGSTGVWTGSALLVESADVNYDPAGPATCSVQFRGTITFA